MIGAWHYDGRSATRHAVTVEIDGGTLRIGDEAVPISELRPIGDRARAAFTRQGHEGWRLGFDEPLPPAWRAALPRQEHHGGLLDRIGVVPALLVCALIAAVAAIGLWRGSALLARLVPERWERTLGDSLTGDFGGGTCGDPAGQRALDALAARLATDGRPPTVRVIDLGLVNAVTLPGRRVLIFAGLLRAAKSPDEVAGVLGHEMGHVVNRDAMAGIIRNFGISLLIGGADGGAIANALLTSRYSRAAERGADAHALASLVHAHVSPAATAAFFERLGQGESHLGRAATVLGYVSSHPLSAERRQRFRASRAGLPYRPALDPAQWQALRSICRAA